LEKISQKEVNNIKNELQVLVGLKLNWLAIPSQALKGFEPSQIAVIINTLLDAALPQIELLATDQKNKEKLKKLKLSKPSREIGERESYPDYVHASKKRIELKGLFVDNLSLNFKRPPTKREPSARLKENITMKYINPKMDVLLIAAVQLEKSGSLCYPVIIDIGVFPMVDCIISRDKRLYDSGGKWIKNIPCVISLKGAKKSKKGQRLTNEDYEKDTNFGKLKRIPYKPLQEFMKKHGAI